ncbi:MAG: hypothetical protein D3910_09620 [Candidatus Electrothrix sp. ATG2]|nr:hypothetical protein [Candidatus Electrothrix sp. ATG2]
MKNLGNDINEIQKIKDGEENKLSDINPQLSVDTFKKEKFAMNSVITKTFILFLARKSPITFISGTPIDLEEKLRDCNRKEFHHLMPRAYLNKSKQDQYNDSCLANFCFLSRADNRQLGGAKPSIYKEKITGDITKILESHYCPHALFDDKYEQFVDNRSQMLFEDAKLLCDI